MKKAISILKLEGFRDIKIRKEWYSLYDIDAIRDGKNYAIVVKIRNPSSKTQFFTFRDTKIRKLGDLNIKKPVMVLLINKYGYKLISLNEMLNKKFQDIKFFKYKPHKPSIQRFPVEIPQPFSNNRKKKILCIRCSESTIAEFRKRFYTLKSQGIVKNMDDFVKMALKSIPEKLEFR